MGFEPINLHDLAGSNHRVTGDSMVSKSEMWVFDWNCIARSHGRYELIIAPRSHIEAYISKMQPITLPSEYHMEF